MGRYALGRGKPPKVHFLSFRFIKGLTKIRVGPAVILYAHWYEMADPHLTSPSCNDWEFVFRGEVLMARSPQANP
jgi:hypothetical protein